MIIVIVLVPLFQLEFYQSHLDDLQIHYVEELVDAFEHFQLPTAGSALFGLRVLVLPGVSLTLELLLD